MKKIIVSILAFVVIVSVLVGGFYALNNYIYTEKQGEPTLGGEHNTPIVVPAEGDGYKNAEYVIDGVRIKLTNGASDIEAAPGSAERIVTNYFGNELKKDLDGDGREDVVFLVTQDTGGTGFFVYVVAALNTPSGYVGSEAFFLGDRIAPQTTESGRGKIVIVNYADRAPGEPFSALPSVGKSVWLLLDPSTKQFGEVEQNFEGEADPERMTLDMKTWVWISALYNDGREIVPKQAGKFSLKFEDGEKGAAAGARMSGRFTATTDCNNMSGSYSATRQLSSVTGGSSGGSLSFSSIISTKMFCEGSQEADFATLLQNTSGYHFTSRGELILDLKFDSGSVVLR